MHITASAFIKGYNRPWRQGNESGMCDMVCCPQVQLLSPRLLCILGALCIPLPLDGGGWEGVNWLSQKLLRVLSCNCSNAVGRRPELT